MILNVCYFDKLVHMNVTYIINISPYTVGVYVFIYCIDRQIDRDTYAINLYLHTSKEWEILMYHPIYNIYVNIPFDIRTSCHILHFRIGIYHWSLKIRDEISL